LGKETVNVNNTLHRLYEATAEDLLFGIGQLQVPDDRPVPYIHIHYANWSREKLDVVRESFPDGLILTAQQCPTGAYDVTIKTRHLVILKSERNGRTSLLRGPAWDARLEGVEPQAFRLFQSDRQRHGGFVVLVQTPEWEFMTVVDEIRGSTTVGATLPRTFAAPPAAMTDPSV
jgi:hypothetical protein